MVNDYSLLARLPLLGGISSTDLLGWEETLRLSIDEFAASRVPLIRQGDRLQGLKANSTESIKAPTDAMQHAP